MRVLLVGDGKHDVGAAGANAAMSPDQRTLGGVVGTLVRRLCPAIAADSAALRWAEIRLLGPWQSARPRGYAAKVAAVAVLAEKRLGVEGVICVADRDGQAERAQDLENGRQQAQALTRPGYPVVCGVAVESIEAWTLGAPTALQRALELDGEALRRHYKPTSVEELSNNSGNENHRPKALLSKLAKQAERSDCVEFREEIAENSDPFELAENCPKGFAPFAAALRAAFGS